MLIFLLYYWLKLVEVYFWFILEFEFNLELFSGLIWFWLEENPDGLMEWSYNLELDWLNIDPLCKFLFCVGVNSKIERLIGDFKFSFSF